ncbi:MAG TPA: outer membrane protein transport protein [Candidatus Bathyarchaeia archaeon]|nr:outer membrane protein transport protein [Candidatus Bathyarchaeia archaeon]
MRARVAFLATPWLLVCLAAALLFSRLAHADGFRLLDQGTAAIGQGSAFAAQADDPSAIYYNPAGMPQLPGVQLYTGANLIGSSTTFTNLQGATASGGPTGAIINPPQSFLYLTWSLGDVIPSSNPFSNLALGIGVNVPFGLQTNYSSTGPLANVVTHAELPLLDIKPTAAYRVTPYLSFGAGLDIYTFSNLFGDGQAEQKRIAGPEFALLGIPPGSVVEVNGVDTAVGFNLSTLVTPFRTDGKPRLNIGLVYRSPVTLNLQGDFLVNGRSVSDAQIRFKLPWVFTGAIAWWPVRDTGHEWKVEVDVDHADWSSFKNLDVNLSSGATLPFPQNWSATYVVMAGTEFKWLAPGSLTGWDIAARGGYFHSATPVPSKTFTAAIPDSDLNAFSVGLGLLCRPPGRFAGILPCGRTDGSRLLPASIGVDLAYQAVLYSSRQINGNVDPRVDGRWSSTAHVGSISFRFNF